MDEDFRSSFVSLLSFQGLSDPECVALAEAVHRYIETGTWPGDEPMSEESRAAARQIFEGRSEGKSACHFCGGIHDSVANLEPKWQPCPRVKRIERHTDGTPLVIEHWPAGQWEENVIFPHDAYSDEDE